METYPLFLTKINDLCMVCNFKITPRDVLQHGDMWWITI